MNEFKLKEVGTQMQEINNAVLSYSDIITDEWLLKRGLKNAKFAIITNFSNNQVYTKCTICGGTHIHGASYNDIKDGYLSARVPHCQGYGFNKPDYFIVNLGTYLYLQTDKNIKKFFNNLELERELSVVIENVGSNVYNLVKKYSTINNDYIEEYYKNILTSLIKEYGVISNKPIVSKLNNNVKNYFISQGEVKKYNALKYTHNILLEKWQIKSLEHELLGGM